MNATMQTPTYGRIARGAFAMSMLLVALIVPGLARASCTLTIPVGTVNLGRTSAGALAAPDAQGMRRLGERSVVISGTCDTPQAGFRLAFSGLQPLRGAAGGVVLAGSQLLAWGAASAAGNAQATMVPGAVAFHITGATVGGTPVPMRAEGVTGAGTTSGGFSPSLELGGDEVVTLDVARVPPEQRKSFTVQVQLTGSVAAAYKVQSEVTLDSHYSVQVIDAR